MRRAERGLWSRESVRRYSVVCGGTMRRRADDEVAELAALADGSLAPERRAAVEAHVAASPELAERLAEQQRALAYTRQAAADVDAPAGLRRRVEARRGARRSW